MEKQAGLYPGCGNQKNSTMEPYAHLAVFPKKPTTTQATNQTENITNEKQIS